MLRLTIVRLHVIIVTFVVAQTLYPSLTPISERRSVTRTCATPTRMLFKEQICCQSLPIAASVRSRKVELYPVGRHDIGMFFPVPGSRCLQP